MSEDIYQPLADDFSDVWAAAGLSIDIVTEADGAVISMTTIVGGGGSPMSPMAQKGDTVLTVPRPR